MSEDTERKRVRQWAYIFQQFDRGTLRGLLTQAAREHEESGRVVVEFRDGKALAVSEHVEELENEANI